MDFEHNQIQKHILAWIYTTKKQTLLFPEKEKYTIMNKSIIELIPKVSVIISTYSSESFMKECLDELVKQTIFEKLEIIVIDAASPQKEKEIVTSYQKRYDNIFYLRLNKRIGIYPAWNIGIKKLRHLTSPPSAPTIVSILSHMKSSVNL